MFERGEQEDARLFLSWIIDQFSQNVPATSTKAWQAQHQAFFQVVFQPFDNCTVCGHVKHQPREVQTMLNLGVFDTHESIYEALQDTLIGKVDGVWCDNCRQTQVIYRASDIAAA
jgi:ribosomal protein S27E